MTAEALADGPMLGFYTPGARQERDLEQQFDGHLDAAQMRRWLREMSDEPNQVGSPHDRANAQSILRQFTSWGWQAQIETFTALYPTSRKQSLQLLGPRPFNAALREPPIRSDAQTLHGRNALPPYAIYGADGDVTAELIYVNYGMPEDYRELARLGLSVKGRIVIARYGSEWRGTKTRLAAEHGAVGCILYSDPRDDGYFKGEIYPGGGFRPAAGVQRGSVLDIALYPGDPAAADAMQGAPTLTRLPVIPISYRDAEPFLRSLGGPIAPTSWRGALPFTYHLGPGRSRVHLLQVSNWARKPLYDVIATLRGSERPEEWVIRGNHHDAWVFGAYDPLAAHVSMMAEARAIGLLARTGWRPKRTLIYASWDGEEPGFLGSTAWAQAHAQELQRNAVAYLNSDNGGRGFLTPLGSPALRRLVTEVAADVRDPEVGASLRDRARAKILADSFDDPDNEQLRSVAAATAGGEVSLDAPGSGSDWTPFLQHLGIASLHIEFDGEDDDDGILHSLYDTYDHYLRFGDPGLRYGIVEAQVLGRLALRLADADILPIQAAGLSQAVGTYVAQLHELVAARQQRDVSLSALRADRVFALASDPRRPRAAPVAETVPAQVNFAPLETALIDLKASALAFDRASKVTTQSGAALNEQQGAALDTLLIGLEQSLLVPKGLPGRPWYRHMIYAPGMLTGYSAKTLPGIREAIEASRWAEAQEYVDIVAQTLTAYAHRLDEARTVLDR